MKIAAFFHTRAFVIAAASLAAIAILIVVVTPAEPKIAEPRLPAAPAPDAETRAAGMTAPDVIQPILEPQRAPHPPANSFLETVYPPSRLPDVATAQGATISLACLARNGADLSKPMPSKHTVFAANAEIAARLRAWAQTNGFEVRDSETLHGHTGTPEYRFDLVRVEVPIPENIEREGRLVLAAVQQIPGAYYQTWSGEIVR